RERQGVALELPLPLLAWRREGMVRRGEATALLVLLEHRELGHPAELELARRDELLAVGHLLAPLAERPAHDRRLVCDQEQEIARTRLEARDQRPRSLGIQELGKRAGERAARLDLGPGE